MLRQDALLCPSAFEGLPPLPPSPFRSSGLWLVLVSHAHGLIEATPGFDRIRQLQSFASLHPLVAPGEPLALTVDLFSAVGFCVLMHANPDVVDADVRTIRSMETDGSMFQLTSLAAFSRRQVGFGQLPAS